MNRTSLGTAENKAPRDAASRIFRIENHDEAMPIWRDSGGTNRRFVTMDACPDKWRVPPGKLVTKMNFNDPAPEDAIPREPHCPLPDGARLKSGQAKERFARD